MSSFLCCLACISERHEECAAQGEPGVCACRRCWPKNNDEPDEEGGE